MSETREGLTRRQDRRVTALTVGLAVLAVAAVAGQVTVPRTMHDLVWCLGLVVLFATTEGFVVHIRVRRGAHALGLGDVPTVLGLLAVDPFLVVLSHVVGGFGSLWGIRGQRGSKLRFNMALVCVQGAVGASVFRLCGAEHGPPGPREWLAAYAAVLIADAVAVVAVTAVIALHDDPGEWRRLPAAMRTVPLSAVAATIALISTHAAHGNAWVLALLGILLVAVHLAYRAFVQQRQGRAEVDQLYAFTRALNGVAKFDDVLTVLLGQVRDQLRAGAAELVVPGPHGVTRYLTVGAHEVSEIHQEVCDDPWVLGALAGQPSRHDAPEAGDALAVPVAIGDVMAALVVVEPLPDSGAFDDDRLHLLEALANHAGVALTKVELVERLLREAAEKEHVALHDSLSGLPNRRHFHTLITAALVEAAGRGTPLAVLVLDVDRFAEVNDALGHGTGDALLVEIADRLKLHVAGRGVVGRIGGDEFAVALGVPPGADGAAAEAAALAAAVGRAVHQGPLTLHVRASIGVAVAPGHGADADALIRHADVAMYAAKRGHTGIQVYEAALDRNAPRRLALIADLRRAIEAGEVRVVFQPKLDPATGVVVGAEALARWTHPEHGAVPPDEFVALAEHSGLIRPLTVHVLETALRQRAQWADGGSSLHVAVNLSPKSLSDAGLPEMVARLLTGTATPAGALTLEITESTLMVDPEGALANLHRLEALGVKLSIDDFGTGYSSLSRLRTLPIHEVKVDRSFVQRLAVDHRDRALVRAAIQMGHALDLLVVAEGVEDADTAAYLVEAGCDTVQGFYYARPLPPEEFAGWLAGRRTPPAATAATPAVGG